MSEEQIIGHNTQAGNELRSIVERVERLNQEIAEVQEQRKEVFAEAKGRGFDVKPIRQIVAIRKKDRAKAQEERAILELYANAIDPALVDLI